ncbi:TonB-dependent receptor [Mucilaginibacter sp.]|uniref:TonB-dependent receptor n=1 Tax=Mucilaginibacter sp. TaxID=1882438 RepID=UPI002637C05A|nr:TonB-dependent receptor [Mucilaginibacter sp.]MDB4924811.1 hypothetical protein [Mucilaginibacter sp.]
MKKLALILLLTGITALTASAQGELKSTVLVNGSYTTTLDLFLDNLASKYHLQIVFNRGLVSRFDVVEHYDNEPLKNVLNQVCKANDLHYWVDADQVIYVIKEPQDVTALKKMRANPPPENPDSPIPIPKSTVSSAIIVHNDGPAVKIMPKSVNFTISGKVIDQGTGESLPASIITIRNSKISTTTNVDGNFTIVNVPADTCKLDITYMGYRADTFELTPENIKENITIGLFASNKALNEVVINDKRTESLMSTDKRRVSVLQISPQKLETLPSLGEKDILRSFQLMPGVSGSNESSSGVYVRGGTPDQNLVLFDGFTVYQVDHLYGFFSAFNSNAVKDVTLYKGGFSAKYGGRLSSVTDMVGKEGNKKEANYGIDLSLLSANAFAEMPLGNQSTLLLAYRHSYQGPLYNKIFQKFNSTQTTSGGGGGGTGGPPRGGGGGRFGGGSSSVTVPTSYFYDLNAKYTYTPDQKNLFSWSLYQGNDNLDNSRILNLPSFFAGGGNLNSTDKTTYGNLGSSLKWSRQWSPKLYSNTLLSYSTYHSDRNNSTALTSTNASGVSTTVNSGTFETNNVKDLSFKSDWEWQFKNNYKLLFGTFVSHQDVAYNYSQNDTSILVDQHRQAVTGGVYTEVEANPTDKLQIKPGVRTTYYNQTSKLYFEPRLSATYTVTDQLTLKASTGRFNQFTDKVIREDVLSGSRDFWVLANGSTIPVATANHYISGFSYETKDFLVDVEGYYKQLGGLTQYSERQTGNRRTGITLEQHFYTGTGYTRGVEVLLQKTRGNYTGWISYTLADAINNFAIYGGEFPANQDTKHEFKTVHMYKYGRWSFAATWIFATGRPYTAPLSSFTINDYAGNSHNYLTISAENGERLPNYSRLDAAVTYDLIKTDSRKIGSIGFSLFNMYNRANVWYKQYTIVNNQVITSNVDYLGFTPNITLSLRWK